MSLEQLKYLIEVSKGSSLNVASQKLNLTTSALSRSISSLENELNLVLLKRNFKGITLTETGMKVVQLAKDFFSELDNLKETKKDSLIKGHIAINTLYGQVNILIPPLLAWLYKNVPNLTITTDKNNYDTLIKSLIEETLEFAFIIRCLVNNHDLRVLDDRLSYIPVMNLRIYCRVSRSLPISTYKTISMKEILRYPIIIHHNPEDNDSYLLRLVEQFGHPKKLLLEEEPQICVELLRAGLGVFIGIAPSLEDRRILYNHSNVLSFTIENVIDIPIKDNIKICYGYVVKRDRDLSSLTKSFLDSIEKFRN